MTALTPRQAFDAFQRNVLAGSVGLSEEMCTPDLVVEQPFAPHDAARRITGYAAFRAFAEAAQAAIPIRVTECTDVVMHEGADAELGIFEYSLTATVGEHSASAPFIVVCRMRGGRICRWREYQNAAAMAQVG